MKNLTFCLMACLLLIFTNCTDECADLVCLNGGQCQTGTCICPEGFTGTNCENSTSNNPCANINCQNGGTCNNGICNCPAGYTGTFCETQINTDPCANISCQNGGTCNNGNCDCLPGFTGTFCENQIQNYSQVTITSIRLSSFSSVNNDEDLYISISDGADCDNNGYITVTAENVVFSNPYTFNTDYLMSLNQLVSICLWSDPFLGFDFTAEGAGYTFNTSLLTNNYPSSYVLQNQTNPITFELFLDYD